MGELGLAPLVVGEASRRLRLGELLMRIGERLRVGLGMVEVGCVLIAWVPWVRLILTVVIVVFVHGAAHTFLDITRDVVVPVQIYGSGRSVPAHIGINPVVLYMRLVETFILPVFIIFPVTFDPLPVIAGSNEEVKCRKEAQGKGHNGVSQCEFEGISGFGAWIDGSVP